MSRKNNLKQFQTIVNGDMSGDIISPVTCIQFLDNVGLQFNFTGDPVGTFNIQVSADYSQDELGNVQNVGNWITLTPPALSAIPEAAGSADVIFVDLNQLSAPWIRVQYAADSGSGVLNAFITAKLL